MSTLSVAAQIFGGKRATILLLVPLTLAVLVFLQTPWLSGPRSSPLTPDSLPQRPYPPSVGTRPQSPETNAADPASSADKCRSIPGAEDVLIVLKTGASEIYQKLPEHFLTLLGCTPNYLIVSDVEQSIGGHHVYDVLTGVSEHVKKSQAEFQYYRHINELVADGQSVANLKSDEAWSLDKWKFLPMVRTAYKMRPTAKWFFFIEADTAVVWPNLLLWIKRLNPDKLIYTGSQNSLGDLGFAHGGSGILASHAAIKKIGDNYAAHEAKWENDTIKSCCGDAVLAQAFLDVGVELTPGFPLIQGEAPATIDWNERHMCSPSVTWHHVSPVDIDTLWRLQQNWTSVNGYDKPILFRDIFPHYVDRYIRDRRDEWDNISENWKYWNSGSSSWDRLSEIQRKSVESFEDCRAACVQNNDCLQFKYQRKVCVLGADVRVGKPRHDSDDSDARITSGWLLDRVADFKGQFKSCHANWDFDQ